jgi:hypothetical protein
MRLAWIVFDPGMVVPVLVSVLWEMPMVFVSMMLMFFPKIVPVS